MIMSFIVSVTILPGVGDEAGQGAQHKNDSRVRRNTKEMGRGA